MNGKIIGSIILLMWLIGGTYLFVWTGSGDGYIPHEYKYKGNVCLEDGLAIDFAEYRDVEIESIGNGSICFNYDLNLLYELDSKYGIEYDSKKLDELGFVIMLCFGGILMVFPLIILAMVWFSKDEKDTKGME